MAEYLTRDLIHGILVFQVIMLVIIISNRRILHRARQYGVSDNIPSVSILVPARNEERNIERCIKSLLAQDYPAFEVVVLDDQSSDRTRLILEEISKLHPKLRILDGLPSPKNELGKNWACSQLAQQAEGELFFFTDADTFQKPNALNAIVNALLGENADLLSGYPRQEVHTWGERLLVPFFSWALYCFVPLSLAYRLRLPFLSGAVGQVMLFRRDSYFAIGGHEGVSLSITEDLVLTQRIKEAGMRWRMVYISDMISCRMYEGFQEALDGFSKNLFAAFGFRLLPFCFVFLWLAAVFWLPIAVLALVIAGLAPLAQPIVLITSILLSVLLWIIPYADTGISHSLAFLYPLTLLANEFAAFMSLKRSLSGRITWKGRTILVSRWRWL